MYWNTLGAAIGYSSGKNNSSLKTPPTVENHAMELNQWIVEESLAEGNQISAGLLHI